MFYVEGWTLDSFFEGSTTLKPSHDNKIGIVFDKAIPQDVLNVHINTMNAVKTVYGVNIVGYEITSEEVGVEFFMTKVKTSEGRVKNIRTLKNAAQHLLNKGATAIAIVCMFDEPEDDNPDYANGLGSDPVGGVEAILSHYISRELKVPCAHSPAFADYSIYPDIVNPKSASEYITPTFLPCILLGLSNAPLIGGDINISQVDYLIMPYDALGSTPVFEAIKRNIPVYAVKENSTVLNVTNEKLHNSNKITVVGNYEKCLELIVQS